jgi:DNA-binding sugar fermentation-stimulating protein
VDGIFLEFPNHFIAYVGVNGTVETVHVKNTGRFRLPPEKPSSSKTTVCSAAASP